MFKEKYLIFKEGEPSSQSAKRPENPRGESEGRKAQSGDTAGDLLSKKSVEEKTEEVVKELNQLFTGNNSLLEVLFSAKGNQDKSSISEKFFKKTQSGNFLFEAFLGNKMKAYVMKKISDGFEFAGYGHGGITLLWWSPEKEMVTEINSAFLDKKVYDLLNEDTKKLITKAKLEVLEKKLNREIKPIFEKLVLQNMIPQTFTFEQFIKSDFAQDLRDLTKVNHDTLPTAYTWEITPEGVSFTPSEEIKEEGFPEMIELKIKDYDSNLNYKKNTPKYDVQEASEEDEIIDEDEISEEQEYNEELQACEDDLDLIASEDQELEKLHFEEVKPHMKEVDDFIQKGIGDGVALPVIKDQIYANFDGKRDIIRNKLHNFALSDSYEDEYDGNTDSGSEQLAEDYGNKLEEWIKILLKKYGLPLNNYTSSDSEEFEEGSWEDDGLGEEFFEEEKD